MLHLLSEQLLYAQARLEALQQGFIVLFQKHGISSDIAAQELEQAFQVALQQLREERQPHVDRIRSDASGNSLAQ
jgi:hypothetical protein